ncbi:MAG: hypothetical protein PHW08_06210 [Kiritimatiellae bacterium]|nr:hypothetical protein [Kiritimatiellia bacterium]
MICPPPKGFEKYVEHTSTKALQDTHLVVRVSKTPPEMLEKLRNMDRIQFEYDGEHAIEFLEE